MYALTDEAALRSGYPHISRLPNGGPPFHPHCTHSTLPFLSDQAPTDHDTSGTKDRTVRGTPVGALDVEFKDAQKFLREKGGVGYAAKQNPQLLRAKVSRFADDKVTSGLKAAQARAAAGASPRVAKKQRRPRRRAQQPPEAPVSEAVLELKRQADASQF